MNRQQGPSGQTMRNLTNIGSQPSTRSTSSRLVQSKPGAWNSASQQSQQQSHESSNSWAQAMNPRTTNQLDLSSSSFPSLAGGNGPAQTTASSQWQAGPPSRDTSSSSRILQRQTPRDSSFDFSSVDSQSRYSSHSSMPRGAPPGLAPVDGMSPDSNARKTPVNGTISQDRNGDDKSPSPTSSLSPYTELSEKDKWGMAGYQALHSGAMANYRDHSRQADVAAFEHYSSLGQPLSRTYAGAFAAVNSYPPRPLDSDFTIPDCYIVTNVAPVNSRISGFTEDTLFYIFYTSPKDIIQEEVATELMSRKWRFHMKEKMWLTRDDTTSSPVILEKDVCEQGYYIWWDFRNWKRVRKLYMLRYEDLDDHLSGGRSLAMPGLFQGGPSGINGSNGFNAVPVLERMAAQGNGRSF